MRRVILYGRPGCCLCDEAREVLAGVSAQRPFALEERNIEDDEGLLRAYLERIPVVTIDGVEAFELFVDPAELAQRLDQQAALE
ncbi:MAG: hypothetical protein QOF83_888 [Solirubrobacteraceae bacterium]|nr:hypothetical protein [Solirubrobacteraceae bacterium]